MNEILSIIICILIGFILLDLKIWNDSDNFSMECFLMLCLLVTLLILFILSLESYELP